MSDMPPCVVVLIGNDDKEVELACACARRLYDVLKHTRMFSGHPVCGHPILLLDKSKEEIMERIRGAVRLVKDHDASWLAIYYAGHSFWDDLTKEIVIEPKSDGGGMKLEKQVKLTMHNAKFEKIIKTIIFVDSCLEEVQYEAEHDYQLGDLKSFLRNEDFELVRSCRFGFTVRDGCLFARAIERCARESLDQEGLIKYVQELARQLSCGRLCPESKCPENTEFLVLSQTQRRMGLIEDKHFLRFALDLWTEKKLALDPQAEDKLGPEGLDIDKTVKTLKSIVKEFETKQAAFEEPWCELEAIVHCESLEDFEKYMQHLKTVRDVRDGSGRPTRVLIPENVRGAIVEVLQENIKKKDFQFRDLGNLGCLVENMGKWYGTWEGIKPRIPPETGTWTCTYSLVVEGLDVKKLPESDMKTVAEQINQLREDFDIPGRVYLVPGSLWIIFCTNIRLSRDCRRTFAASLKSWIDQKHSGASGWTAQDPCWKPLYAVPDRILHLVRQVEKLCGACLPTKCMWLRASDLRNLVARERKLEEWRVVVFEGLMERRGDSWLQGTGTLGCCLLEHFEDERLEHRMQEVANLACKRKQSMRPEVQALVFLLQRAQLELTDEEWTQVVDSARVCYERLKTMLRKVMLDKDTDLICGMNDIIDDPDWELVDSGPVKDCQKPSGSNGRDAAAATAANKSNRSDDQVAQVFMRGWNSGLNYIADQVWSPSSRQVFLSSEGLMASLHEISSSSVLDLVQ